MARRQNSIAIAGVAVILGILLVIQLRSQGGNPGLEALSAQELTVLVANLNTGNDQLRTEIASLEQEVRGLTDGQARGQTSVGQLQLDLSRVRAWSGLSPVTGPGVRITVSGPISGNAIEDLLNELRNAGSEALAVEGVRVVAGSVVSGAPDQLTVENASLPDPFEVSAVGNSETLTGTLTRSGGIIAQLAATFPDAQLTVTPVTNLQLTATSRSLSPVHGHPKL